VTHVNIAKQYPDSYQALAELDRHAAAAAADASLDQRLVELVKIRVSQLNGCAFCLRTHTADAIKHGEPPERLAVLPAWWESQYFTDTERAALQLAEQVTLPTERGRLLGRGADPAALTDKQAAAVTWLTIVINAWNRVAVFSHYPVSPEGPGQHGHVA
jgi:AhpD family alkylhydroperoxidase